MRLLSWLSGIIAFVLIILGLVAYIAKTNIFGVTHAVNFFHVANSLLLLAILTAISSGRSSKS